MVLISGISDALPPTVDHSSHKEHKLRLVTTPALGFNCDLCKRFGEGSEHYRCEQCDFDAHADCATSPVTLKHAHLPYDMTFELREHPEPDSICMACVDKCDGLSYYSVPGYYLHPCCAFLPTRVIQDGRAFELGCDKSCRCGMCGTKYGFLLFYRSSYDDGEAVYLHVICLRRKHISLTGKEDWVASAPIRPGVLDSFTRRKRGGEPMKVVRMVFDFARMVGHLATLDIDGVVKSAKDVGEAFKD